MTRKERTNYDGAINLLNGVIRAGKTYPESDIEGTAWNQWAIKKATRLYNAIVSSENE